MLTSILGKKLLFFDGAMGSMLQKRGLKPGEPPEMLNITNPETVIEIHKEYLEAGSNIISTNTFGAYSIKYDNVEEIVKYALQNAKEAIKSLGKEETYVALSLGPTGKLLKPMGDLDFEDCVNIFKQTISVGARYGADLVLIETMSDTYEMKAACIAIKESCELPFFATMTFDTNGHTMTGCDIQTMVALLEGLGASAIGINCGLGAESVKTLVPNLAEISSVPILVQPNAGLPEIVDGVTTYNVTPEEFASTMSDICKMGACVLGGCCGTTPEHIKATVNICKSISPSLITDKNLTIVSSYSKSVLIDKPTIIGERLNPTNRSDLATALREKNMDFIIDDATEQIDLGAKILNVNVSVPQINETETMLEAIKSIQEVINTPLSIDSSNRSIMEKAVRLYNGKCIINSTTGKLDDMNAVFPIAKKYGAVVICLTMDENGIPKTAEERFAVAEKILKTANEYGIHKKDIIIDPLNLALISYLSKTTLDSDENGENALVPLRTIQLIKQRLGLKTVLGLSNISHGLGKRELANSAFFSMALFAGIDACIFNPQSEAMMYAYNNYLLMSGLSMDIDFLCNWD